MWSNALISVLLALFVAVDARVTFPFSEVLQKKDLTDTDSASFNCIDGCTVYANLIDDMQITLDGVVVANLTTMVSRSSFVIDGLDLPGGENYELQYIDDGSSDFVFYVVSNKKPNTDPVTVYYTQEEHVFIVDSDSRYFTILTSSNALQYFQFTGTFPEGYPRIYATGFDAVSDVYGEAACAPVYQARSQITAEQSILTLFSPIVTVDFGFKGTHNVSTKATASTLGENPRSNVASTVYMSPGYVGCPFEGWQVYASPVTSVSNTFTLFANSLDIAAEYNKVADLEIVHFRVNQETLDFYNATTHSSLTRHYNDEAFNVELSWTRVTKESSWAMQLDFGLTPTMSSAKPSPSTSYSPPPPPPTTTSKAGGALSVLLSSLIVIAFASVKQAI